MQPVPAFLMQSVGKKTKTVTKLVQSRSMFGMLVRAAGSGRLVQVQGTSLTWLQQLDRTTGECLLSAADQRDAVSPHASAFGFKVQVSTLDGAGSNHRCERAAHARRVEQGWLRFEWTCSVHKLANVHSHVFALADETIRGQIHLALSLNTGNNLTRFNKHLRAVVSEQVRIKRGTPPPECLHYKRQLLALAMARGSRMLARRLALWSLPNGDWTKREIDVWVPEGVDINRERIVAIVSHSLQKVVSGVRMTVYPRHRWTRSDEAFDQFLLLEGLHQLASQTWQRFQAECCDAKAKGWVRAADAHLDPGVPAEAPEQHAAHLGHGHAEPNLGGIPDAIGEQSGDGADFAAARLDNERHRQQASAWLQTKPFGTAAIVRQTMEPLSRLMRSHLELGSNAWERCERAKSAKAFFDDAPGQERTYPILELAKGVLEGACQQQLWLLMSSSQLW